MNSNTGPDLPRIQHELSLRVYYEDTDATGIVYHASYLKFMERARTDWLRYLGFEQSTLTENEDLIFVVVNLNLDYKQPAYFDEQIMVKTELIDFGGVSLKLCQRILNRSEEIVCSGFVRIGCIDTLSWTPKRIPQEIKRRLSNVN
ncbi:MAG: tol-pal system-associated acyl-CoA thioesterase [Pseudomonadota bacterium]|nr:tol-pal system-associated acyl-CoA thioesterase [Pseudomonadota bacterium]